MSSTKKSFPVFDLIIKLIQLYRTGGSPESGLGTSHNSLGAGASNGGNALGGGDFETGEGVDDNDYYDVEPLQPLGTCKALYPFEGIYYHILY